MSDYHWNTASEDTAQSLKQQYSDCIISKGIPARDKQTIENGIVIPAQSAIGDPSRWYLNIRSDSAIPRPEGVDETDPALSRQILGEWAE